MWWRNCNQLQYQHYRHHHRKKWALFQSCFPYSCALLADTKTYVSNLTNFCEFVRAFFVQTFSSERKRIPTHFILCTINVAHCIFSYWCKERIIRKKQRKIVAVAFVPPCLIYCIAMDAFNKAICGKWEIWAFFYCISLKSPTTPGSLGQHSLRLPLVVHLIAKIIKATTHELWAMCMQNRKQITPTASKISFYGRAVHWKY